MANIFCTKKLQNLVGKKLIASEQQSDELLGNWNANIFTMNRRKCLIVMNDTTYYCLLFLDILKKDLLNFQELFYQRLIEQFDYDGLNFPLDCSSKLLNACEPNFLGTNNNRKVLGTMNKYVYEIEYFFHLDYHGDFSLVNLPELNNRFSNDLVGALKPGKYEFGRPHEEMRKLLEKVCA